MSNDLIYKYFRHMNRDYRCLLISADSRTLVGIRGLVDAVGFARASKLYYSAQQCSFDCFTAKYHGYTVKFYNK